MNSNLWGLLRSDLGCHSVNSINIYSVFKPMEYYIHVANIIQLKLVQIQLKPVLFKSN